MEFTTTVYFVQNTPRPEKADPLAEERRRRLRELARNIQQEISDGKVPYPLG